MNSNEIFRLARLAHEQAEKATAHSTDNAQATYQAVQAEKAADRARDCAHEAYILVTDRVVQTGCHSRSGAHWQQHIDDVLCMLKGVAEKALIDAQVAQLKAKRIAER